MQNKPLIAALAVACACIGALIAWRRLGPDTYVRYDTMFGKARIYQVLDDEGQPVRLLEVGGIVQSGTYLEERYTELVFEYLKRYDLMFERNFPITRVCVLGCGGYDYPEHLIAHHPSIAVDAVEIDPAITALARRYFHLDRLIEEYETEASGRLNLVTADALDHLLADGPAYDAIVNDAFDAGTPPSHLTTPRFAHAVHDRLAPGGIYLVNIVSPLDELSCGFAHDQLAMLKSVFKHVKAYPCGEESLTSPDNIIVAASDSPLPA